LGSELKGPVGYPDFTKPVSIAAYTIETLPIDIKTQTADYVKVDIAFQTAEAIKVDITGSVDINIKTSGETNIVIDKLTQEAYTERRVVHANNAATPVGMAAALLTFPRGKWFPRGCRGQLGRVLIYCDNADTVDHILTVKAAPFPRAGVLAETELTVPAGATADWRAATFAIPWEYDSLFVWVKSDHTSYPRVGYDEETPHDTWITPNEIEWGPEPQRLWVRLEMRGLTVGDLPVSGTIEVVNIFQPYGYSKLYGGAATTVAEGEVTIGEETPATAHRRRITEVIGGGDVEGYVTIYWGTAILWRGRFIPKTSVGQQFKVPIEVVGDGTTTLSLKVYAGAAGNVEAFMNAVAL